MIRFLFFSLSFVGTVSFSNASRITIEFCSFATMKMSRRKKNTNRKAKGEWLNEHTECIQVSDEHSNTFYDRFSSSFSNSRNAIRILFEMRFEWLLYWSRYKIHLLFIFLVFIFIEIFILKFFLFLVVVVVVVGSITSFAHSKHTMSMFHALLFIVYFEEDATHYTL